MIKLLPEERFPEIRKIFSPLTFHLAVEAVLMRATPGKIWLDDLEDPAAGLLQVHHRFYISGDPTKTDFIEGVRLLFLDEILPAGRANGEDAFTMYFSEGWGPVIENDIFQEIKPIWGRRYYYEWNGANIFNLPSPEKDLQLIEVDKALLVDTNLVNLEDLLEEMQSERSSVEEFLQYSFGLCLRSRHQIITWCLSEYNSGNRCEIGIATHPDYRKRGLAVFTGSAFLRAAAIRGYTQIGWHCWASNEGSWKTAEKIGLAREQEYDSFLVFFQHSVHQAVHGDILLNQGRYSEALNLFTASIDKGDAPGWVYLSAACACAQIGAVDTAFKHLHRAAEYGVLDRHNIEGLKLLEPLIHVPAWTALLNELESE